MIIRYYKFYMKPCKVMKQKTRLYVTNDIVNLGFSGEF